MPPGIGSGKFHLSLQYRGVMTVVYVELHCHSAYSFLDGASLPEELVEQACRLGMKALALTDHNGLYGSMEFAQAAKAWGIQPLTGAEVSLEGGYGLTLLAATSEGYANLCRLLSRAHLDSPRGKPCLSWDTLCRYHKGLIALVGGRRGEMARRIDEGRWDEALAAGRRYRELFGPEHLWIELQQGFVRGDTLRIKGLVALAKRLGLNVVATNDVHYHVRERHRLQDVLVAIRHRTTLDASHRQRRPNAEAYLKSPQEMAALFAELPQALRATEEIAERCSDFDLTADLGYAFPDFYGDGKRSDADEVLESVCREALEIRYQGQTKLRRRAEERLQQELELVRQHGLSGFFLVYRDLMQLAEEVAKEVRGPSLARMAAKLPPGRGRGSSVSSLICYLIGLSHVDPIQNGLSIERFLNDSLSKVPDIDLDFPRDIRAALIERVYAHYGREHAALVCSFATYRLRSAIRDVGKAFGLPTLDLEKLAKVADSRDHENLLEVMQGLPEFAAKAETPLWRHFAARVEEILGFPRHISQHVGGMVISSRPLIDCVPIEPARMAGRFICQWDKDSCEDARMIKVDFLSLGMLSLVEECVEQIAESQGKIVDLSRIPFDDQAVFDQIAAGDTIGIFQIESRAQMQLLPRTQPRNLDELAIEIAIVRPGPIVGGAVHPYVSRRMAQREAQRQGKPYEPPYDHPLLKKALEDTLGVLIYQDQVLQAAMALAGFSAGQAEALRRALGRKRSKEAVQMMWERFSAGAAKKGVSPEVAKKVFEQILSFSQFGFPKSHAYAFAVLAYQSAWLRYYYPAAYVAALLNNQPMGFYPPHVIIRDAQRHGIDILPLDINRSAGKCKVEGRGVRIGFNYVKGLSALEAEHIVESRERDGPFASLADFMDRVDLSPKKVEKLIMAGVFDGWKKDRREQLWTLGLVQRAEIVGECKANGVTMDRADSSAQIPHGAKQNCIRKNEGRSLWQPSLPFAAPEPPKNLPRMQVMETIAADYKATGISTRKHILGVLRARLPRHLRSIAEVSRAREGMKLFLAGTVVARQRPETARGVLFILVEDETGLLNVVVRPELYERKRAVIRGESFLVFSGKVQKRDGTLNFLAEDVWPLDEVTRRAEAGKLKKAGMVLDSHDFR